MRLLKKLVGLFFLMLLPRLRFPHLNRACYCMLGYDIAVTARICTSVKMTGNIEISIGHGTFVGDHTKLTGGIGGIRIGENCDISDNVIICSGSHNLGDRYRRAGVGTGDDILIGDGAWIGLGAIVLSGVTIGKGAVIGAGAVVVGDVPENSLVAGNPAVVKRIFLDE